ncbi:MAG: glycoside hydrolase family 3 protein [Actinomycetota bacterium]|nr:glycoside hydrolase family 3 protein [Actinomycetota bacterium]
MLALCLGLGLVGVAARTPDGVPAAREISPGPAAPTPTPAEAPRCTPEGAGGALPLRERLAQLLIVGVDAGGPDQALAVVTDDQVGGIFLGGNATGLLTDGALAQVRAASAIPLAVAVDDEGGRVQRIDALDGELPSARDMAADLTPQQVYELARRRGEALRARGVTIDFAPSVDVSDQPDDAVIGDRSFSSDAAVTTRYADAFARGLRDAEVLPVLKHFPGHGRAGDSHTGEVSTPPLGQLQGVDLVPYRQLIGRGADAVMMGHLDVPGLTEPGTPASISPAALALLRDDLGFDGLVLSDDLGAMRAITDRFDLPEAVRASLAAGVDMALWVTEDRVGEVLDHLEAAVAAGSLPEKRVNEAVRRVLAAKGVDPCALP